MSLINDALRKAKAAQHDTPPQANVGPALRPVETDTFVRRSAGWVVPLLLTSVALLILFFVWRYAPLSRTTPPGDSTADISKARARTRTSSDNSSVAAAAVVTPPTQEPAKAAPTVTALPLPAVNGDASIQQSNSPATALPAAAKADVQAAASTNLTASLPATNALPVKPALPKLQGIVFDPRRPSAVINGKTLFLGDRVAGFRLTGIGQNTATLVGGGQTNVLSLED